MNYFAYGSNMNLKQMKDRCPKARFIESSYLENYRFVYDGYEVSRKGSVGNLIQSKGSTVWGALFEVDDECVASLDHYEGYPKSYQRELLKVKDNRGNLEVALVYLRNPKKIGKPSEEYRKIVQKGARDCGLPKEYIKNNL